ncbi:efflux RND transporter periplasmic adaptor subunit [Frankia sp. Cj5]|uniref:efflux RND transporter periplasmic adaptor subunit n=1 Tax=Frankia sp. Cj5 TaxID=2880978 RepID=UPI001EF4F948|nr:biotin/lipoyl-binding protein [Frankia sp. Cj5]
MADRTFRARRRRVRSWAAVAVAVVVVGGAGGGMLAATASSGPSYRTAAVTRRTVEATVSSVGSVAPVSQASISFPVAGRVAQVPVAVGQHVATGDILAELDTSSLVASLDNARAALALAQAKLAADQASQTTTGTTSTSTSTGTGTGTATGAAFVTSSQVGTPSGSYAAVKMITSSEPRVGSTASGGASQDSASAVDLVRRYQRQLLADQHAADTVLYQTQADLAHEQSVCRAFLNSFGHAAEPMAASSARGGQSPAETTQAPSATQTTQVPEQAAGSTPDGTDCSALLKEVLAEQETLNNDLRTVAADETALDAAVAQLLTQSPGGQPAAAGGQPSPSQTSPGAGAGSGGHGQAGGNTGNSGDTGGTSKTGDTGSVGNNRGSATRAGSAAGGTAAGGARTGSAAARAPASAAQIAADQASVDAANAMLPVAAQSLDQARIVSPIDGLVAAVNIAPGQSVTAGSSTAAIVVVNPGAMEVTTTVSDSNVAAVKVGAKVTVTPDGTDSPTAGTVVAVGLLPTVSTASTGTGPGASGGVAYPVTIGLNGGGGQLFAGSGAAVSIVVSSAVNALAVPTSAVRTIGNRHIVSVLRDAKLVSLPVEVGAAGVSFTQITSGLSESDRIILADLHAPLPTSNTTLRGLGGVGATGGGFAGGGAPTGAGRRN